MEGKMDQRMVDPRDCLNFRQKDVCLNQNQELLDYLDNKVICDFSLHFDLEEFDKAFAYCAICTDYSPLVKYPDLTH